MKKLVATVALGCFCALQANAQSPTELFVTVNSGNAQTQGMAFVLATQVMEQKANVRVLLCSEGGQLAVKGKESAVLKPRNVTPNQMLQGLMKAGAKVEVCALFLPNSGLQPADLIDGVNVAKPADVAAYMMQGNVKTLTY
ncbi:MAG: DsrE family protein [Rhodocyclaceae bacterium]|nr:DsrE family protein [Rhodocyclaceae bacterium]